MNNEMAVDYMPEIKKAQAAIAAACELQVSLLKSMPPGRQQLDLATIGLHLVTASVALGFREPGVPCRLDFVSEQHDKEAA